MADSSKISYSRSDSIRTEFIRVTDSVCTAKGICVGQEAKVGGNLSVGGDIMFSNSTLGFRVATAPSLNNTRILNIGDFALTSKTISTIPNLPCFTSSQYSSSPLFVMAHGGGFISRFEDQTQNTDQSLVLFQSSWGQAHIESEGTFQNNMNPYPDNPLLINYFCNNDVAIGTGSVSANGKFSRVYVGNFLRANKHVEIGDSVNGISGDNNNIGLLVHTHSGAGVKVRTYSPNLNAISIQNTGSQAPENYGGMHTFQVRGDGQTMILTKGYNAAFTVKQFNTASSTPTVFRIEGTGDTRIYTQSTLTPFSIETGTGTVFRVTGNRRVGIGTGSPNCGLEIEPEQNINGVCVKVNHTQPYGFGFTFEGQNAQAETKAYRVWWNNKERFVVYANGKTIIGDQTNLTNSALLNINCINNQRAIDIYDQQTNSVNFRVYSSGFVYAREIEVTTSIIS